MIGSFSGFAALFSFATLANELDFTYNPSLEAGDKPSLF